MWASCIASGGPVWGTPSVKGPRTAGHTSHHVPAGRTCRGLCLPQGAQAGPGHRGRGQRQARPRWERPAPGPATMGEASTRPGHDGRGQRQARLPCLVVLYILFSTGSFLRRSKHRGHPFGQLVCGCVAWPAVHLSIADLLKGCKQLQQLTGCWWVGEGPALQVSAVGLLGAAEGSRRRGLWAEGRGAPHRHRTAPGSRAGPRASASEGPREPLL